MINTISGISDTILVYLHEPPGPNSHPFEDYPLAGSAAIFCTGGPDVIRKEAWPTLSLALSPSLTLSPSLPLSLYKYVQGIAAVGRRVSWPLEPFSSTTTYQDPTKFLAVQGGLM